MNTASLATIDPRHGPDSLLCATVLVALSTISAESQAQAWPQKPIRLLVGFAPGGGTDIVARALGQDVRVLGQTVVVENRAGASGTIAADLVAKSPPDGYTLLMGHSNSNAIAPFVLKKRPLRRGDRLHADHLRRLRAERAGRQSRACRRNRCPSWSRSRRRSPAR